MVDVDDAQHMVQAAGAVAPVSTIHPGSGAWALDAASSPSALRKLSSKDLRFSKPVRVSRLGVIEQALEVVIDPQHVGQQALLTNVEGLRTDQFDDAAHLAASGDREVMRPALAIGRVDFGLHKLPGAQASKRCG